MADGRWLMPGAWCLVADAWWLVAGGSTGGWGVAGRPEMVAPRHRSPRPDKTRQDQTKPNQTRPFLGLGSHQIRSRPLLHPSPTASRTASCSPAPCPGSSLDRPHPTCPLMGAQRLGAPNRPWLPPPRATRTTRATRATQAFASARHLLAGPAVCQLRPAWASFGHLRPAWASPRRRHPESAHADSHRLAHDRRAPSKREIRWSSFSWMRIGACGLGMGMEMGTMLGVGTGGEGFWESESE
jgi:hypothetical protein